MLLFLFLGGGIFYGLKVWQGTALGCPEPLIQEIVKHHEHEGISNILPYQGYAAEAFPYGGIAGGDIGGIYSYTPPGPPSGYANVQPYVAPNYLPPTDSYGSPIQASQDAGSQPPSRRYSRNAQEGGRQISDETVSIFTDLIFRFLGVQTDVCRRRFVCELEFRNPHFRNAIRYIG